MASTKRTAAPDPWIEQHLDRLPPAGTMLDLACGTGRHTLALLERGCRVVAVDADLSGMQALRDSGKLELRRYDLEAGRWPFAAEAFAGIVVCNYLHRPLLPSLADSLAPGGVLVYSTFMDGHERLGRPRNPEYLLRPGELRAAFSPLLRLLEYSQGYRESPRPMLRQSAVLQKLDPERG